MKISFKKKIAAAAAAATIVGGVGIAYGYWTTTGSGDGSATTASENGTLVLHAAFDDGLTPGASEDVTFTADNVGTSSLWVETIHLASVTADDLHADCDVDDFTMPDVSSKTRVPADTDGVALDGTGTVSFADTAFNQDACKGSIITLNLTSN